MTMDITINIGDYSGWVSGTRVSLYLDPEKRLVYSCGIVGSGTPEPAWNRRHLDLGHVGKDVVSESLEEWLRGQEATLAALCDCYEGTEWDGHNHVGQWSEEASELEEAFDCALAEAEDIAHYWDAVEYFSPAEDDVIDAATRLGIEAAVDHENDGALSAGVHLTKTEEAIVSLLQRRLENLVDTRSAWERLQRLQIRRVLMIHGAM